ncbi:MAG: hypothetical protein RBT70_01875 [Alphaproteobacteria bacterium]|jgi:hypothetical protein|nr:hypothetical protein [Alphaproteobacteria bacterium]
MSIFKNFLKKGVNAGLAIGRVVEDSLRVMFGPPSVKQKAQQQVKSTLSQKFFGSKIGKPLSPLFRPKYFYQGLKDIIRTKEIDISLEFIGTTDAVQTKKYVRDQNGVLVIDPTTNDLVLDGEYPTIYRKYRLNVNNKGYGPIDELIIRAYNLPCYPDDQSKLPAPDLIKNWIQIINKDGPKNVLSTLPQGQSSMDVTLLDSPIYLGASGTPLITKKPAHLFINQISAMGYDIPPVPPSSSTDLAVHPSNSAGSSANYGPRKQLFTLDNYAWSRIEAKSQRIRIVQWVGRFATIAALIIAGFKGIGHWSDHQDLMRRQTGPNGVFMPMKEPPKTIKDLEVEQKRVRGEMAEKHRKEESSLLWRMQHPGQAEKNEAARQKAVKAREEAGNNERQKDNESASELFKQAAPSGTKQEVSAPNSGAIDKSALQKSADYSAPNRNGPGYGGKNVIRTNGKTSQYSI